MCNCRHMMKFSLFSGFSVNKELVDNNFAVAVLVPMCLRGSNRAGSQKDCRASAMKNQKTLISCNTDLLGHEQRLQLCPFHCHVGCEQATFQFEAKYIKFSMIMILR